MYSSENSDIEDQINLREKYQRASDNHKIRFSLFLCSRFGCASRPNTLLVISEILETINQFYQQHDYKSPEIKVFPNDLPENDFNNPFRFVPAFWRRVFHINNTRFFLQETT